MVSIPHRYAENFPQLLSYFLQQVFQFLIGTLRTRNRALALYEETGFQFLIGTLRTIEAALGLTITEGFNSS